MNNDMAPGAAFNAPSREAIRKGVSPPEEADFARLGRVGTGLSPSFGILAMSFEERILL